MKVPVIRRLVWAACFGLTVGSLSAGALADDDSSSDVPGGFVGLVEKSTGVVLKVPVNDRGEEWGGSAELRLDGGGDLPVTSAELVDRFDKAVSTAGEPVLDGDDVHADSSTHGWRGYGGYSWYRPYHYGGYRPVYNYYGYHYTYYPYSSYSWAGYRYYYYRCGW